MLMGQIDRRTDGRTPDHYSMLSTRRGQCYNSTSIVFGFVQQTVCRIHQMLRRVSNKITVGLERQALYGPDVLPITQSPVSKHEIQ